MAAPVTPQENYLGQDLESSNYLSTLANRRKPYAFSTNRMGRQGPVHSAVNHDVEFVTNHAHNYKRFRVQTSQGSQLPTMCCSSWSEREARAIGQLDPL